MTENQPLEERIVDVLREAPDDDASAATVRGLLARREGIRPAVEDVRDELVELVGDGRVEVVPETDGSGDTDPRYRLVDTDY